MDLHYLVKMTNQIASFFEPFSDRQEAKDGIVSHLIRFWEPRMREQLFTSLLHPESKALNPLAREAISEYLARREKKR